MSTVTPTTSSVNINIYGAKKIYINTSEALDRHVYDFYIQKQREKMTSTQLREKLVDFYARTVLENPIVHLWFPESLKSDIVKRVEEIVHQSGTVDPEHHHNVERHGRRHRHDAHRPYNVEQHGHRRYEHEESYQ
jgi:hypothetical protein